MKLLANIEEFKTFLTGPKMCVVHYQCDFADECKTVSKLLTDLSQTDAMKDVNFVELDAEAIPEASQQFSIIAVPTVVVFRGGKELGRVNGAKLPDITMLVRKQNKATLPSTGFVESPPEVPLEQRLKELVNRSKVMLFMKGNPDQPRCGFSKKTVAILKEIQVEFDHFDILTDQDVRQGLKEFSNWPTYPQLYCNGELLGGLDIIQEMNESNELKSALSE